MKEFMLKDEEREEQFFSIQQYIEMTDDNLTTMHLGD